jgi:hypothetical protein
MTAEVQGDGWTIVREGDKIHIRAILDISNIEELIDILRRHQNEHGFLSTDPTTGAKLGEHPQPASARPSKGVAGGPIETVARYEAPTEAEIRATTRVTGSS